MSTNVGSIHYDLGLDTSKFDAASESMGAKLSNVAGTFVKFGKMAAVALGAAGVASTGFAVKSAASFEQTRIGLENMLGSADKAKKLLSDVSDFAAQTPFEFPELADATRQLIAFGFSGDLAFSTMKQLGDVSAAVGAPIGELAYLMGTLKTQGKAMTIDIRQFAQRGIPIYEYLAKVLKTTEANVAELVTAGKVGFPEVQKAFEAMTAEGGKFNGTMAKQSKSLTGLFSTLKDSIGQTARELVGISKTGDIIEGSLFDKIRKGTAYLIESLPMTIQKLKDFGSAFMEIAMQVAEYLQPKLQALGNTIADRIAPLLMQLYENVLKPLLPIFGSLLVGAVGLFIDVLNILFIALASTIEWFKQNEVALAALITVIGLAGAAFLVMKVHMAMASAVTAFQGAMATVTGSAKAMMLAVSTPFAVVILVAAALAAIASVVTAYRDMRREQEAANKAVQEADRSTQAYIKSLDTAYQKGKITAQQADTNRIKYLQSMGKPSGLPQYATGTSYAQKGMALVGERGPELVQMRGGEKVYTNDQTNAMLGGRQVIINGDVNASTPQNIDYFISRLSMGQELASDGLAGGI